MMFSTRVDVRVRLAWSLVVVGLFGAGCSQGDTGPERYDVSGVVTFNGQPVPFGDIRFVPDTKQGNSGPAGFATITNGRFNTAENGRGTVGGAHQVVINGTADPPVEDEEAPPGQGPLFPEYRADHELPKQPSTQDFQIPAAPTR